MFNNCSKQGSKLSSNQKGKIPKIIESDNTFTLCCEFIVLFVTILIT